MKTTQYYEYTRKRADRAQIKEEWIKAVIKKPERIEIQSDGRIRGIRYESKIFF
jgi:hypothetical protein